MNLIAIFFLIFNQLCFSQNVDWDQVDQYLEKTYELWGLPGMSVGVVKDGELVYYEGYGKSDLETDEKPNKETLYAIASNSKAFTATIIQMLVEEGKLNWNDKVVDYLPYFEIYDKHISQMVSIKDLLTHRVGLGTFSGDIMWYDADLSTEEIVKRLKYLPKAYDFRDGFGYSNVMYITAGDLIEKVTGKTWCENVTERIFKPLGMNRSICDNSLLEFKGNWAKPYATKDDQNVRIRYENWNNVSSTGGIISCVSDLAKWVKFNCNNGIWNGDTLVDPQFRNTMWTGHNQFIVDHTNKDINAMDFTGYGLGFFVSEYKNHFKVSHTGGYGGMLSSISIIPKKDIGVILLSNDTESPLRAVPNYIFDRFLDPKDTTNYAEKDRKKYLEYKSNDKRIQKIKDAHVLDTEPSFDLDKYEGKFWSDLYGGNIYIIRDDMGLLMKFEHSPHLDARLKHWHYDVFEVDWLEVQPWFGFGTVQFEMDNNHNIKGLLFDIPNDDFFFEELSPYKRE